VQTVEGEKELQVPAGTQPDETLMLPKLGSPKLNKPSSRGDHYFIVKVKIPTKLRYSTLFGLFSWKYINHSFEDNISKSESFFT
jgi:DnaJ-class molecular chaperone